MKLSEIKNKLNKLDKIAFQLPNGEIVPNHFHVTEVGKITKHFIDCGGTVRNEEVVNFQLWNANDYDHRLHPEKLLSIIELSERVLGIKDLEIEVEYQGDTIGKFGLDFDGKKFLLNTKHNVSYSNIQCGTTSHMITINISEFNNGSSCTPGSGCC